MSEVLRAIGIFVWSWTTQRGHELVTAAPKQRPGLLIAVSVTAGIVSVLYILIKVGVL